MTCISSKNAYFNDFEDALNDPWGQLIPRQKTNSYDAKMMRRRKDRIDRVSDYKYEEKPKYVKNNQKKENEDTESENEDTESDSENVNRMRLRKFYDEGTRGRSRHRCGNRAVRCRSCELVTCKTHREQGAVFGNKNHLSDFDKTKKICVQIVKKDIDTYDFL